MQKLSLIIVAIVLPMSGCTDPAAGTSTSSHLRKMPDLSCIDAAMKAADPRDVSPMVSSGPRKAIYSWDYGGDLGATLEIDTSSPNDIRYLNTNVTMGSDTTRAPRFAPLMRRVNAFISQRCNVALQPVIEAY